MQPSGVPAFIASAPPIVAGIPTRHSRPPRLSAAPSRMSAERLAPAPATASSPLNSERPRQPSSLSTTRSEEHTSELQSLAYLVCRLLLEKKKTIHARKKPGRRVVY